MSRIVSVAIVGMLALTAGADEAKVVQPFNGADLKDARFEGCSLDGVSFKGALNIPKNVARHLNDNGIYEE